MAFHQVANNAIGTIQSNPLGAAATSVVVNAALDAILSPLVAVGPIYVTMWANNLTPTSDPGMEIGEITARTSANTYTIGRAKQSTSASQHNLNDNIAILWTLGNIQEFVPAGSNVQGAMYYVNSSGLPNLIGPGTLGQVLVSQGASANPIFQTPSSKLFSEKTPTSLNTSITTEQTLSSFTLPGGTLGTAGIVRFRVYISVGAVQTSTFGMTYGFYYGGVKLFSVSTPSASTAQMGGFIEYLLMGAGTTGTQSIVALLCFNETDAAGIAYTSTTEADGLTIDSTVNQTVQITAKYTNAGGLALVKKGAVAEVI